MWRLIWGWMGNPHKSRCCDEGALKDEIDDELMFDIVYVSEASD